MVWAFADVSEDSPFELYEYTAGVPLGSTETIGIPSPPTLEVRVVFLPFHLVELVILVALVLRREIEMRECARVLDRFRPIALIVHLVLIIVRRATQEGEMGNVPNRRLPMRKIRGRLTRAS